MSILSDNVEQIIIPRTNDIGGFEVFRALPSRQRRMVGPFIFWDQMGPGEFITGKGVDVRPHPHIGLSTVTYLFDGTLDHKDSLGTDMRIAPGDVNLMTAGSGIVHSERTGQDIRQTPSKLFGIQSWIALPKTQEEKAPEFSHIAKDELPLVDDGNIQIRLIAGDAFGKSSPLKTFGNPLYADIIMREGETVEIDNIAEERALYPLNGRVRVGDTDYEPNQLLILAPHQKLTLTALTDLRIMLMGGDTMDGERHIWWNFVSSSKDRIEQAKQDWRNGKFDIVPNDNDEFIPLPE